MSHHPTTIRNMSMCEQIHYGYISCENHPDSREFQNDLFECAEVNDKYYSDDFVTVETLEEAESAIEDVKGGIYSMASDARDIMALLEHDEDEITVEDLENCHKQIAKLVENIQKTADSWVEAY